MKKGSIWPYVIGGALAIHVVVSLVVVFIATSDPSYAVEENYYQKAIAWDDKRAQDRDNESLGWEFEFEVTPPENTGNDANLEITLLDRDGLPLSSAAVSIEAFHNSRADDILRAEFPPTDETGTTTTTLPMEHNGRWELRFTVEYQGRTFTHSETRHLFVEGNSE